MSDDLKERLQKHDWKYLTSRIEALEAQLAESRKALEQFSPAMFDAYSSALRNHITSVSADEREGRWGKPRPSKGYRIPEKEKAEVRWRAMLAAALPKDPSTGSGS